MYLTQEDNISIFEILFNNKKNKSLLNKFDFNKLLAVFFLFKPEKHF